MKLTAEQPEESMPLLKFLSLRFVWVSKTKLRQAIGGGRVTVNGYRVSSARRLQVDDVVSIPDEVVPSPEFGPRIPIEVVFEDEAHLVTNKPAGFTVLPRRDGSGREFFDGLLLYLNPSLPRGGPFKRPYIVHRLDRGTSGVLLVAKNEEAGRILAQQFEKRRVRKTYLAIIEGVPPKRRFTVDLPISRKSVLEMCAKPGKGKPSVTEMTVLRSFGSFSLIEARPGTGRQHQVRVHAAAVGFPMAVDFLYGRRRELSMADLGLPGRPGAASGDALLLDRCPLHAAKIEYFHPVTGESLSASAPMPEDMQRMIRLLEKGLARD